MKTEVIQIDPEDIDLGKVRQAAEVIKKGGIVGFPTETVYGLAADFANKQAVRRIFEVKKRPKDKPLTVQIHDVTCLEKLVDQIPVFAYQLMGSFWPGPLTLVFLARPGLNLTGGKAQAGGTLGVRIPANKVARALIEESNTALVAPSANLSGQPEAKTAEQVLGTFAGLIEMVIDAGAAELGTASTVVDLTVSPPKVLREGIITERDIFSV